jgi:hypothetical protein
VVRYRFSSILECRHTSVRLITFAVTALLFIIQSFHAFTKVVASRGQSATKSREFFVNAQWAIGGEGTGAPVSKLNALFLLIWLRLTISNYSIKTENSLFRCTFIILPGECCYQRMALKIIKRIEMSLNGSDESVVAGHLMERA